MKGVQFSLELNEFVAAAVLITIAVLGIGYWHEHRVPATVQPEPQALQLTVTVRQRVKQRIIVPKPKVVVVYPTAAPNAEPSAKHTTQPLAKVWDNDNIPHADDPVKFKQW